MRRYCAFCAPRLFWLKMLWVFAPVLLVLLIAKLMPSSPFSLVRCGPVGG